MNKEQKLYCFRLASRCITVWDSCKTSEQRTVAAKYANCAIDFLTKRGDTQNCQLIRDHVHGSL